jgi:predicted O-methyltransferase YrrM
MTAAAGFLYVLTHAGIAYDHWAGDGESSPPPAILPPHRLIVADDPAALAHVTSATVVVVPLGSAAGAPRFAVAMAGEVPSAVLAEVAAIEARSARDRPLAPVSADVGRLLHLLCRARRARSVLEIGAGAGTATLWLASGVRQPGGRVVAIEKDSARRTLAVSAVARAGMKAFVDVQMGDADRLLDRLDGRFDLVLLDETAEAREGHLLALFEGAFLSPRALLFSHGGLAEPVALARTHAHLQVLPAVVAATSLGIGAGLFVAVTAPA